jgi:hypothetical protein
MFLRNPPNPQCLYFLKNPQCLYFLKNPRYL